MTSPLATIRAATLGLAVLATAAQAQVPPGRMPPAAGVNLAGGEFGKPPGRIDHDYHYPSDEELAWAAERRFVVIRMPFLWERVQPTLGGPLDGAEAAAIAAAVERARAHRLAVILDLHGYGRWNGRVLGSPELPISALADVWRRLARRFGDHDDVIFGMMNEPHDLPIAVWAEAAQTTIDAIRQTGTCNLILVPGANWTGAHSWKAEIAGVSNAAAMAGIRDSGAMAFEFHQYLDQNWSGTHATCRRPEEVVAALAVATDWLRERKARGFLGEFGAGSGATCLAGLDAMAGHMSANADVWIGWTYWAAGAWWAPDYPLSIQPSEGVERPQMRALERWIGDTPAPGVCRGKIGARPHGGATGGAKPPE